MLLLALFALSGCGAVGGESSQTSAPAEKEDVDVVRLLAVPVGLALAIGVVGGGVWLGFHMDRMGEVYRIRREYRRDVRRMKRRARREGRSG